MRGPESVSPSAQHLAHDRFVFLADRAAFAKLPGCVGRGEAFEPRGQLLADIVCDGDLRHAGEEVDRQTGNVYPLGGIRKHGNGRGKSGASPPVR